MTGMILDAALMLLLVAALAYGVRLEKKLTTLRQGQLAFAGAVAQLNQAAERAENALASLRHSAQETDLLHDRIIKAREAAAHLETLLNRATSLPARPAQPVPLRVVADPVVEPRPVTTLPETEDDERALRMAALARRIEGLRTPGREAAQARGNVEAIVQALTANRVPKQTVNPARGRTDDDLFAA